MGVATGLPPLVRRGRVVPGQLILMIARPGRCPGRLPRPRSLMAHFPSRRQSSCAGARWKPGSFTGFERPSVDRVLCRTVARAPGVNGSGPGRPTDSSDRTIESVSERLIGARLPLALLSRQIVTAMVAGPAPRPC